MWVGINNSTLLQENDGPFNNPGAIPLSILLAMITLVAGLMIGFTIVALFRANAVLVPDRLYLINLLFAGLIVALVAIFGTITCVIHVLVSSKHPRPLYLCRVYLWAFGTSTVTWLWSLTTFSLSTLAIVLFSKKTIYKWSAAVIVLSLWIAPMILSLYILFPYVYKVQFIHNVACYPIIITQTLLFQLVTLSQLHGLSLEASHHWQLASLSPLFASVTSRETL